jgi:hypothetical protein
MQNITRTSPAHYLSLFRIFRTCEGEKLLVGGYEVRCQTIPVLLPVRVMCLCVAYEVRGASGGSQAGNS